MSIDIDQLLREQWRELGFYYEFDKERATWRLVGSLSGLIKFRDLLNEYAARPGNEKLSEHEHYGPYMYLKVVTWSDAFIAENGIFGTPVDLKRLASLVDEKLRAGKAGDTLLISSEYAESSQAKLEFVVRDEGFDPAGQDQQLNA